MKSATRTAVPWLTAEQAAVYLGFPTVRAFRKFLRRSKTPPPIHWLGERMRFRQVELDACVQPEPAVPGSSERPRLSLVGGRR